MNRHINKLYLILSLLLFSMSHVYAETTPKESIKYEIHLKGNSGIETKEYLSALGIQSKSSYEFWKDDKNYISKVKVASIKSTLKSFLDSRGYYGAKISLQSGSTITVSIHEGKPTIIKKLEIKSDFDIKEIVTFTKGGQFQASKFISIKHHIKKSLMKSGYCRYKLDTKAYVDLPTHSVSLKYSLSKGKLCRFGDTKITSKPDNISERTILSRIQYKKGEVFSTEKVTRSFDMLNQLDAFDSGTLAPGEYDSYIVPMELGLSPKEKLNQFRGGVGYDTAVGLRAQLFYERRNFLGEARKLTLGFQHSDKSKYGEISLFSPAFISIGDMSFDLFSKLGYSNYIYDTYKENKGYQNIKLGYQKDELSLFAGFAVENIDIKMRSADPTIIDGNFLLFYPFAEFTYDARDSKINPKNGYFLSAYTEYGLDYKPGASNYLKFLLEGRYISSFGDLTLATVGKLGVIDSISGNIPASKLFYAGGAYSNRAYGEKELGTTTSSTTSASLGGKSWFNLSIEADYKLYDDIYGALFLDSTMINKESYDFNGEMINSAGVGFRYITPIGPVKLDIAANIDDIDIYSVQFQIGQSF